MRTPRRHSDPLPWPLGENATVFLAIVVAFYFGVIVGQLMRSDVNGCSTCPIGQEQYEEFQPSWRDGAAVQYDYRHTNGHLFSTVAPTLEEARRRRNVWLTGQRREETVRA